MDSQLPMVLAASGTLVLVVLAILVIIGLLLARKQIAISWHRLFAEPADAARAKGDLGEILALAEARALARDEPELDLRIYPGRRVKSREIDLAVVTPSAVWIVECKAWQGRLAAGADGWISWSAPRRGAPLQQRRRDPVRQARAQSTTLGRALEAADLPGVPVREAVLFTNPEVDLDAVRDQGFVLYLDELAAFFTIGPGSQGPPMREPQRVAVCRFLDDLPGWDFVELEGGGRRGRLITDHLEIRGDGQRQVPLEDIRQATFTLQGWPRRRVEVELVLSGGDEPLRGTAVHPTAKLWLKEQDGQVHPYPLCVVSGFIRATR